MSYWPRWFSVPNHPTNETNEDYLMRIDRESYVNSARRLLKGAQENDWKVGSEKTNSDLSNKIEKDVQAVRGKMCRNIFAR